MCFQHPTGNQLPNDIIGELIQNLPYSAIIRLCHTNRRFYHYCKNNPSLINQQLLKEALNKYQDNLDNALVYAVIYNNISVVNKLLSMGAKPYYRTLINEWRMTTDNFPDGRRGLSVRYLPSAAINRAIKNRNIDIIISFLDLIDDIDIPLDNIHYLISYIIYEAFSHNLINDYILKTYSEYISAEMINKSKLNHVIYKISCVKSHVP